MLMLFFSLFVILIAVALVGKNCLVDEDNFVVLAVCCHCLEEFCLARFDRVLAIVLIASTLVGNYLTRRRRVAVATLGKDVREYWPPRLASLRLSIVLMIEGLVFLLFVDQVAVRC